MLPPLLSYWDPVVPAMLWVHRSKPSVFNMSIVMHRASTRRHHLTPRGYINSCSSSDWPSLTQLLPWTLSAYTSRLVF